ncbi:corticotropin-releasing factor receptor 1 [Plakobranchus ocellatus]|uniref:Corticotropin-releasing factor receptor 1 n=1 Tax=Plakobranchus ocellatus TaxID=259542 RepID=A0AAV4AJD8_9GAST|nr:corticotropin-releasing factor receptor 1 [Plakobranchus ocellatus]
MIVQQLSEPGVQYCQSTWDSFLCWPATKTGELVTQKCPDLLVPRPDVNATKQCFSNGSWDQTDYSECLTPGPTHPLDDIENPSLEFGIRLIYLIGFSITIVALVIALAIFSYFRSLRCLRNLIHCNLICAFLLNSIAWLILHSTVGKLFRSHEAGFNYFQFTNHTSNVQKHSCLLTTDITYDYILHGPVILLLVGNLFFITAIIWVLVTKLRDSNTLVTRQSKKAANATLVLFPLLGVTYIFFIKEPVQTKNLGLTFKYVNAVLQSFQGLFVAIIYCFLNGEVQSLIRQKLSVLQDSRTLSRYTRSSFFGSPRRSSCYAMGTTTSNGRNAPATGGNTTTMSGIASSVQNLSTPAGGSRGVARDETTVLVVCGNGSASGNTGDRGKKNKVLRSCDTEIEASESMMENML